MQFEYYYNNVPGVGHKTRNNLIYTSLISADKKVFCQWYHNDSDYQKGQNQVIDPKLMDQKFNREVKYLTLAPAVIDVHQGWCGPCTVVEPIYRRLFIELDRPEDRIRLYSVS